MFSFFFIPKGSRTDKSGLFIDTPLLIFLSMTFYLHWGKIKFKRKDMKFGRPTHHLKTNKSCLGPGEISYGNNFWEDDFIKFEAGRFFCWKNGFWRWAQDYINVFCHDNLQWSHWVFVNDISKWYIPFGKKKKMQSSWS